MLELIINNSLDLSIIFSVILVLNVVLSITYYKVIIKKEINTKITQIKNEINTKITQIKQNSDNIIQNNILNIHNMHNQISDIVLKPQINKNGEIEHNEIDEKSKDVLKIIDEEQEKFEKKDKNEKRRD